MPRADAIFNLQRVLALVHALQQGEYDRLREAVQDRWHQPARASLVPLLAEALALEDPDVLGAFLSGAGPSVALLARAGDTKVASSDCHRCMSEPEWTRQSGRSMWTTRARGSSSRER